jgi:hypothetical protein
VRTMCAMFSGLREFILRMYMQLPLLRPSRLSNPLVILIRADSGDSDSEAALTAESRGCTASASIDT